MTEAMPPDVLTKLTRRVPMGRVGRPEEITDLVAFLLSSQSTYITGTVHRIGGGRSLH